jgi:dihydroorotate dehydrogenase
MYRWLRAVLFWFDPEWIHTTSMSALRFLCGISPFRQILYKQSFREDKKSFLGLSFPNPIGLGAGFDKNARHLRELEALGFGFVEIGTVTPLPQSGNEKPRLFRLPEDKALINRMGFNNEGMEKIAERLRIWRMQHAESKMIIGGNIGKNKNTPNETALEDYKLCFEALHPWVDYFVVNVSSPNTPGLRALQEKTFLIDLFETLQSINRRMNKSRPILLKIAPDLELDQVDEILELEPTGLLDGLIVSNTTIDRSGLKTNMKTIEKIGPGGLSGLPVKNKSNEILNYIHAKNPKSWILVGSGGIFNGSDAVEKMNLGADLIQIWTGFVYEGPMVVKKIMKSLKTKEQ